MKKLIALTFLSPLLVSLEQDPGSCDSVELFFNSPKDGFQTSEPSFKVEFGSKNIFISPAGVMVERIDQCNVSGHHHFTFYAGGFASCWASGRSWTLGWIQSNMNPNQLVPPASLGKSERSDRSKKVSLQPARFREFNNRILFAQSVSTRTGSPNPLPPR